MRGCGRFGVVAAAALLVVGLGGSPLGAAEQTLPQDLTGPDVDWLEFDNWIVPDDAVYGCTSLDHEIATDEYLSGYGPDEGNSSDQTDGFDTFALVTVNGAYFLNPDDTVDVTDHTITTDVVNMGGLDVRIRHTALQSQPVLRTLVELTNPSDAAITQTVTFEQDLGSDGSTWVQTTSSGDDDWTAADRWAVTTEDEEPSFGDPVITTALYGPGAIATPISLLDLCGERWDSTSIAVKNDITAGGSSGGAGTAAVYSEAAQTSAAYFSVTVPAGQTRYLAFFNSATTDESLDPALAVTTLYNAGLTGDLVEGLDPAIVPLVVNWSPAVVELEPTFTG